MTRLLARRFRLAAPTCAPLLALAAWQRIHQRAACSTNLLHCLHPSIRVTRNSKDCPVAASLTDADRADLLQVKPDAENANK